MLLDPDTHYNADTDQDSKINADPSPQHWCLKDIKIEPKIAVFHSKYQKLRAFPMQPAAKRVDWRERRDENETIPDWTFPERTYLGHGEGLQVNESKCGVHYI